MIRRSSYAVVLLAGLTLASLPLRAQVNQYFVNSVTGNDSRTATQAQSSATPWLTINHADQALALGTTGTIVHVAPCPTSTPCYGGANTTHNGTATQRITFVSDTKWGAKMNGGSFGSSTPSWQMWGNFSTIQDFDITGAGSILVQIICNSCWVTGSHVHNNTSYVNPGDFSYNPADPSCANSAAGIVVDSGHDHPGAVITGNVVHDIGWSLPVLIPPGNPNAGQMTPNPVNCNFSVAIYMASTSIVENNVVYRILVNGIVWNHNPTVGVISNNLVFNISKTGQTNGKGFSMQNSSGGLITNSTMQNNIVRDVNGNQGLALLCFGGIGSNNFFRNNVAFNYRTLANTASCGGVTFANNTTADPQFVNYNANPSQPSIVNGQIAWPDADYHILAGSPANASGTASCPSGGLTPCIPPFDLTGHTLSSPPPAGVYTFQAAGAVTLTPGSLPFGNQVVPTTSTPQNLTLTNSSGGSIQITAITPSDGTNYQVTAGTLPATIANNGTRTIPVAFKPQTTGSKPGTVSVSFTGASGSPLSSTVSGTGINAPPPTMTPATLPFGNVIVLTQTNSQQFTFINNSGISLTITSITSTDTTNFTFTGGGCALGPIASGTSCPIPVAAKPQTTGAKTGTISVAYTGTSGSPLTGTVTVTGVTAPPPPPPTLAPSSNDFGSRIIFTTSPNTNFTLTNTTGLALPITGITVDDPSYVLGSDNCPRSPATLANTAFCTIPSTFQPHTVGSKPAHLSVAYTGTGSPVQSTLAGVGLAQPLPTLLPSSITFADQIILTPSSAQTLTLTNVTGSTLTVTSIGNSNGTDFSVPNPCTTVLNNPTCSIPAIFNPQTTGAKSDTVTVNWTGPAGAGTPVTATLSGTGINSPPPALPTLTPSTNNYGSRIIFTTSPATTYTFTNLTGVAIAITAIAVDDPTNYLLGTDDCPHSPATLANNLGCHIPASFGPQSVGSKPAQFSVSYTGSSGSPISSTLAGVGLAQPLPTLLPSPVNFGNRVVGSPSQPQNLTLTNLTGSSITVTSVVNSNTTDFSITNPCTTILANGTCAIPDIFNPQSLGAKSATVTVNWTGPGGAGTPIVANQSGTGVNPPPPTVTISPTSKSFGSVKAGEQSTEQTFTWSNGIGSTLTIGQCIFTGANPQDFTLLNDNVSNTSIGSSASHTLGVKFAPVTTEAGGAKTAAITCPDNAAGSPHSAVVTGTSKAPHIHVSPNPQYFNTVLIGSQSDITFTVTNDGDADASFSAVAMVTGTNFLLVSNGCNVVVVPAGTCTFVGRFKPLSLGLLSDMARISDDAFDSPQFVDLSGTGGVVAPSFNPSSLNFGQSVTGSTVVLPITFSAGSADVTISNIATSPNFGQSPSCGSVVPAFTQCLIAVTFSPGAVTSYTGTLTITSTPASPVLNLRGAGVAAPPPPSSPSGVTGTAGMNGTSGVQ